MLVKTVEDIQNAIKSARETGLPVTPVGGRTAWDIGGFPPNNSTELNLTALKKLVDYPARDMTITVEAGMTIGELQSILAKENQWLPVDVAKKESATVGGSLAVNASGSRRYGHGTLRDYLIGITLVNDEGSVVKGGGRVVKNVAGYDLMKLHTGALGTLGIITQATFKVKPKPESDACVGFAVKENQIAKVLDVLHESKTRPVMVDVVNKTACSLLNLPAMVDGFYVVVGFEEKKVTLDWQISTLKEELFKHEISTITPGFTLSEWCQTTVNFQVPINNTVVVKANVLPGKTAAYLAGCSAIPTVAHGLNGIVWSHISITDEATTTAKVQGLLNEAVACGGNLLARGGPVEWREKLPLAGKAASDTALKKHIKQTMDPRNLLNPGRG